MVDEKRTIPVVTAESAALRGRRWQVKDLQLDELAANMNVFVEQIGGVLEKTAPRVGEFEFAEVEINAEISGKGQVVLLGVGGEVGAVGGIKLKFTRSR